jgi:signal-transduction protein with cAMP-binding, CBS, and nucleotidyltransferase domain
VTAMEGNKLKRLLVMRDDKLVGIVSRANLLQAIEKNDWSQLGLNVIVRDGIVHLSGVITEERSRPAAIVARLDWRT